MRLPRRTMLASLLSSFAAPAFAQSPSPPTRPSEAEMIAALKAELETRAAAERFWGAVLIAKAGAPVFQQAYGYADRDKMVLNTPETKFRYGSMAKMFTGVSVSQLVQAGKMSFDASVSTYLPDYPNKEIAAATIHQLLTHTAGTGDIFGPGPAPNGPPLRELTDYVAAFGERAPKFPPGSRYEYSNYGMVLAGRIIEVVSGTNYFDYVRRNIFAPAGMTATDARLSDDLIVPGLAVGYTRIRPGQPLRIGPNDTPSTEPLRPRGVMRNGSSSAGGGYSTVGDFARFAAALTAHKLLTPALTELVTTGKVEMGPRPNDGRPPTKYAYGFGDGMTPGGARHFGHNGGTAGVNGVLRIYPKSQYVVVVLANLDPPTADSVVRFIEPRLSL